VVGETALPPTRHTEKLKLQEEKVLQTFDPNRICMSQSQSLLQFYQKHFGLLKPAAADHTSLARLKNCQHLYRQFAYRLYKRCINRNVKTVK